MPRKAEVRNPTTSVACHCNTPHDGNNFVTAKLNAHTDKIACQTCHIPRIASHKPTLVSWDWSLAGSPSAGRELEHGERFDDPPDPHWNAHEHRIAAEALAREIRRIRR